MTAPAIISTTPAVADRPAITYRPAGDRHILVEYGEPKLDLRLNFFVIAALARLTESPPPGFVEAAPGLRSILVSFDPTVTRRSDLIDALEAVHDAEGDTSSLVIPSRRITLPIAFEDSTSFDAVERYMTTIRQDAPNCVGGNNIDYVVDHTGLADREALYENIMATEWWNAFTGFFPGLPFMFPLDSRREITVPKYNPTRTWTAEGAVGIGGPCVAVYPVESPGGYQLFGRTVPIFDILGRHRAFHDNPLLLRPGDRVRFTRVSEEELLEFRRRVFEDDYEYAIEDSPFVVADHLAEAERHAAEAEELRAQRAAAVRNVEVP
ncbi:carboxyltransferase domain-containing protein [Streptomyces meridianus]|uniref:Carboxyltransferase domain-containing protein n=1 Tax=Streptomyces meridianus TaxID=2938945 RepID=A0ABT0XC37_9ACTN|nr:carboxyltransferase domain-containing protein [Streptomyces meridianus]MCM2579498.1 carboxyltransferase domain-containing protein [Streptomyces meridianus]